MPALAIGVASVVVLQRNGHPIAQGTEINAIAAFAACLLTLSAFRLLADIFWFTGSFFEWLQAKTAKGHKGTAGWVKSLRQIKKDLVKQGWGPYWGVFKGKAVIADFASNAMSLAPSGSGKGICVVLPTILAIKTDKILTDFKGELTCILKEALEKRGEVFRFLNIGGLWEDILGESDQYNPFDILVDSFERPGGLADITSDLREMAVQLSPNPVAKGAGGENKFFLEGERDLIAYAFRQCVLVNGRAATLGDVALQLNKLEELHKEALWVCGRLVLDGDGPEEDRHIEMPIEDLAWAHIHDKQDVANFATYHRGTASALVDLLEATESRTFDSFITGARQALAPFNITTRAHKVMGRSTFRFYDTKEGDETTTISMIVDTSRMEAQKPVISFLQWCATTEIKRHKNKHRPVHFIADEATNFLIHNLPSLLTWGRSFGLRLHLILQSISAFRSVYGQDALNTLMSETEIKLFLPGQREPEVLALIQKLLGDQSVIAKSYNGKNDNVGFGIDAFGYREDGKPLMTGDQIRRMDKAILIIRKNFPMKVDMPPISSIDPWRKQIGINPFYGKPFIESVRLRIRRHDVSSIRQWFNRLFRREGKSS